MSTPDAIVVGSGPNGLAAAIELARHGVDVLVLEGHDEIGGGTRTAELTMPGVRHDVCAAAHPLAPSSPFLTQLPLADHGLEWVHGPAPVAHPLDGGMSVSLKDDVAATAGQFLVDKDAATYRRLMGPLTDRFSDLATDVLRPLLRVPQHPGLMARFAMSALPSATRLADRFSGADVRALVAGLCAHGGVPFDRWATAGTGLVLAAAGHACGWPIARGGSHALTRAMASYLTSLGGRIETGRWVERLSDLPKTRATLLDVTPRQFVAMAGGDLRHSRRYRQWRYGVGTFKVDYVVDRPIPWASPEVGRSATVHVGGSFEEIAEAEAATWRGDVPERPFVLLTQPTLFDATRAPAGLHTVWAYSHVPQGYLGDLSPAIDRQIERFAPGFTDTVVARHVMTPGDFSTYNPNDIGGSIAGGATTLGQLIARPRWSPWPHSTPLDGVYLCSSSTAPGPGTHGMSGYHAARTALTRTFGNPVPI